MAGTKRGESRAAEARAARGLPEPPRCRAHARDGSQCKNPPIKGATVCRMHGGSAKQVRARATNRLLEAADPLMAALLKIAMSGESEAVRLTAIRDALDRAGFAPTQMVKLGVGEVESPWDAMLAEVMTDDVLVRVTDGRALPARPGGGGGPRDDDEADPEYDASPLYSPDRDEPPVDLVPDYDEPGVIRGEVVASRPTGHPTDPPRYVRQALADEGVDWRAGSGRGTTWA